MTREVPILCEQQIHGEGGSALNSWLSSCRTSAPEDFCNSVGKDPGQPNLTVKLALL